MANDVLPIYSKTMYDIVPLPTTESIEADGHGIPTITLVQRPTERMMLMYYYNRDDAQNPRWRQQFVEWFGNTTLVECLLDTDCRERNKL